MNAACTVPPAIYKSLQSSVNLLLSDLHVMRKGELIAALEGQMSAMERGKFFFEVRQTVIQMIEAGELVVLKVATSGRATELVALPGASIH